MIRLAAALSGILIILQCLTVSPVEAARPEDRLRDLKEKIRKEEKTVRKIETRKSTLLGSLQTIDKKVALADRGLRRSKKESRKLDGQIQAMKKELKTLEKSIQKKSRETGGRLDAYYRLGRDGILPVLFSGSTMSRKFRDLDALRRILDADWEMIRSFHELVNKKKETEVRLAQRLAEEKVLQEKIRNQKKELVAKRREKNNLLFRVENDENLHKQLLKELNESARDLEALLKKAAEKPPEKEIREPVVHSSSGSFVSRKGSLAWPVKGDLLRKFGRYRDPIVKADVQNRGIDIRSRPEEPVRAVWGGSVVYADWFRGYGNLLIVDHGHKYFTVVSHLSRLTKMKGEPVETGGIVGYAGDTGSLHGCLVHFEIWKKGTPQDPLRWVRRKR